MKDKHFQVDDVEAVIVTMSDVKPPSKNEMRMMEAAYRRGFCQGAWEGFDQPDSAAFDRWYDKLLKWRYKKHNGKFVQPPMGYRRA